MSKAPVEHTLQIRYICEAILAKAFTTTQRLCTVNNMFKPGDILFLKNFLIDFTDIDLAPLYLIHTHHSADFTPVMTTLSRLTSRPLGISIRFERIGAYDNKPLREEAIRRDVGLYLKARHLDISPAVEAVIT